MDGLFDGESEDESHPRFGTETRRKGQERSPLRKEGSIAPHIMTKQPTSPHFKISSLFTPHHLPLSDILQVHINLLR